MNIAEYSGVHFSVSFDCQQHAVIVTMTVTVELGGEHIVRFPTWVPGSYVIREFSRFIVEIAGTDANSVPIVLQKLSKNQWMCKCCTSQFSIRYVVYAWDLSVRGAFVDHHGSFFNPSAVFFSLDHYDGSYVVDINAQGKDAVWSIATALTPLPISDTVQRFIANSYDELIDSPFLLGILRYINFFVDSVPHCMVIWGDGVLDNVRLQRDLQTICERNSQLFGGLPSDLKHYVFLTIVSDHAYGGLEHSHSSALLCSHRDLPGLSSHYNEHYNKFLELCSHEYIHLWWIKRICPMEFARYELDAEQYTDMLWFFEGLTSYYDLMSLVYTSAISLPMFLERLAGMLNGCHARSGKTKQSLAEASFDAWVKFYRPHEYLDNMTVSYYNKGALVFLALDLFLLSESNGRYCLADVVKVICHEAEKKPECRLMSYDYFLSVVQSLTGYDVSEMMYGWVYGVGDVETQDLLAMVGVVQEAHPHNPHPSWGASYIVDTQGLKITQMHDSGTLMQSGLWIGDKIVALNGYRAHIENMDDILLRYPLGSIIEMHVFRHDRLITCQVTLLPRFHLVFSLHENLNMSDEVLEIRNRWLNP